MSKKPQGPAPWSNLKGADRRTARQSHFQQRAVAGPSQGTPAIAENADQPARAVNPVNRPRFQRRSTPYNREEPQVTSLVAPGEFRPGSYPMVLATGPGRATHRESFIPSIPEFMQSVDFVINTLQRSPTWVQYAAEIRQALGGQLGPQETHRFNLVCRAAALICFSQQIFFAHENANEEPIHIPGIRNLQIDHFKSVLAILSQYGNFSLDSVGTRFRAFPPVRIIAAAARLASQLCPVAGQPIPAQDAVENFIAQWWLPTESGCEYFKFILSVRIQAMLEALSDVNIPVATIFASLFPVVANVPRWWYLYIHNTIQAERQDFAPFFNPFPGANNFVAMFTGAAGIRRLNKLDLVWNAPNVDALAWGLQIPAVNTRVGFEWSQYSPVTRRFYHVSSVVSSKSSCHGSPMQLSQVIAAIEGVTTIRSFISGNAAIQSLAIAFPPTSLYDEELRSGHVVNTTDAVVGDVGARWVQSDILSTPTSI